MRRFFLTCLIFIPILLAGNNYRFKNYLPKDGLSTIKSNIVIQDNEGFIWVGTDNGLNRFDGVNFKIYHHDIKDSTSVSGNVIMDLLIDNEKNMWIATNGGVCKYQKKLDCFIKAPDSTIGITYSKAIMQDHNNNYWIATGSIITVFNSDWQKIQTINSNPKAPDYLGNISFFCIEEDNEGTVWIGTQEHGFLSYDLKTNKMTNYGDLTETKEIYSISPDSHGNIWIGTHEIPYIYLKNEHRVIDLHEPDCPINIPDYPISHAFEDSAGFIWLCHWSDGISRYDPVNNTYEYYQHSDSDPNSFSSGSVEYGYHDNNNNLWFVGATTGLTVSYANTRKMYIIKDPQNPTAGAFLSPITSITADQSGNLWLGTDGTGITIWNPEEKNVVKEYRHIEGDSFSYGGPSVLAEYTDKSGRIWCGGYNSGFNRFNPEEDNFTVFLYDNPPPYTISSRDIRAITEDGEGNIWVATNGGGVNKYNPETLEHSVYTTDDGLIHNYCISILYDNEGNILIGSYGGLSVYNIKSGIFKNYSKNEKDSEGLQSNWINTLYKDSKNRYWIGTQLGLSQFDKESGKFRNYFESDGLNNHSIMSIIEDADGNLWIGTMNGLSRFNPENRKFLNFNINDGLPDNQFRMGAAYKSYDNMLYFGTNKGVVYFNPKDITNNRAIPKVVLTDLYVNDKLVRPGVNKILKKQLNFTDKVKLSHNQNFIEVDFVGLSYYQADKNTYQYMLEGVNEGWIDSKTTSYASYTNLRHGKYKLKIQAFNNDGVPSEIRELFIRIKPAWYNTFVFYIFLFIVIAYISIRLFREREVRIRADKKILEKKIKENEQKLEEKIKELELKQKEIETQSQHEKEIRFQTEGLAKFGDVINKNRDDLKALNSQMISELVNYVEANAGVIYLADEPGNQNTKLNLASSFCFDTDLKGREFMAGEGYVGTCYTEKKTEILSDLPENYFILRSGLGDTPLRHAVLVPIVQDKNCLGVIEVGFLEKIPAYIVRFIEKLSETFGSVIAVNQANEQTKEMLKQNKIQAEELRAQEEEMRQNLEEMKATQDELTRQMEETKKAHEELAKEKALIDTLLKYVPDNIYFKDKESRIIKASQSMAENFKVKDVQEIYGKTDFDFFTEEHAKPAFDDEQKIIKTGKPMLDKVEKETHADGRIKYVNTSKMPLYNENGEIIGTFGISKDVTEIIEMQNEIKQRNEELLAQEEELRQNLEEMQTTQEELKRQAEISDRAQEELRKEQALINTMLEHAPDNIYFKDKECRIIKASQSYAKNFNVKNVEDVYGKTDFDFFTEEHARPAYEDEQEIMRTGEPVLDKIEKETHADGRVKYVSTSKMPLYDDKGNIVGTFGISRDITESYEMQSEIQQRNEELLAQEEELRQNLEEMQSIQENLEEQVRENKEMQEKLTKDNALLDALMNNLPDYIYFKDEQSQFIRISKSMLHLFPVKTLEEMIGKSDFDFQPKDVAQKYYDDEIKIVKTGKGIIDDIAHEVMENGVEQWVSTTKLPLYDESGKCIGTFGISKNITDLMKKEIHNQKLAEKLQKREKELEKELKAMEKKISELELKLKK